VNPVALSVAVGLLATLASLPPGLAIAWFLARSRSRARAVVHTAIMLPLVLPPVVTGVLLLKLFSKHGPLGALPVAFQFGGAVVAAAVVGFPLLVMSMTQAIAGVDPRYETASRSLGRSPASTFWRVTLPMAWPGLVAGATLAFARGLGEFGATIVLAGRIPGETETIALAVYAEIDAGRAAWGLIAAAAALCIASVIAWRTLDGWHRRRLET
jgi:molybdate transport system permease protein